ncbi:MAG: Ni/Fe hydrogenase subunit alpha [Alphaproteobacteria bacterium]|nr:Ni/Fe hydrogenase subunit alpha [Alphaproteobacteria bacterium]
MSNRVIKVDALARVEGEGSLYVRVKDNEIKEVRFGIFEPPRFFEAFLRGRHFMEVPDITARICGICPIAYQMGSIQAMENALGIVVPEPVRALRRLIYCGEWIESHALHVYMLHAPDFLGLPDAIQLAKSNRDLVQKALRLKKIGNDILEAIGGGRAIHPVNMRVGGFYRIPKKSEIKPLIEELEWAIEASHDTIRLVGGFNFPDIEQHYNFVALRHESEYAIHEGRVVSNRGLDIDLPQFLDHFDEEHVKHSNALHGFQKPGKQPYHTGPLARYAINYDRLHPEAKSSAKEAGLGPVVRNPFQSIVVRAVEILQVCLDGLAIAKNYVEPDRAFIEPVIKASTGHGCTEAPRGICYHRYEIDDQGLVKTARIMPPTAQNQKIIESDLFKVVSANLALSDEDLKWRCEQAIRNYDPCISCATHFLKLTVERE